jgi:hypothetical protein
VYPKIYPRQEGIEMSDELTLRLASLELYREAEKHGFEGSYAILALAAGIYENAAAILEHNQLLASIAEDKRKFRDQNSGESKSNGRKR